jgi:hypothetical protein
MMFSNTNTTKQEHQNASSAVHIIPVPALSNKDSVRRTETEQQYAVAVLPAAPPQAQAWMWNRRCE